MTPHLTSALSFAISKFRIPLFASSKNNNFSSRNLRHGMLGLHDLEISNPFPFSCWMFSFLNFLDIGEKETEKISSRKYMNYANEISVADSMHLLVPWEKSKSQSRTLVPTLQFGRKQNWTLPFRNSYDHRWLKLTKSVSISPYVTSIICRII